eukprot:Em0005g225a
MRTLYAGVPVLLAALLVVCSSAPTARDTKEGDDLVTISLANGDSVQVSGDEKKAVFKALLEVMTKELKDDDVEAAGSEEESDQADASDSAVYEGVMSEAIMEINSPDQELGAEWWGYKPTKATIPTKATTKKPTKPTRPTRPTTVCPTAPTTAPNAPTTSATTPAPTTTAPTTTAPTADTTAPPKTPSTASPDTPAPTAPTATTGSVPPPAAMKYSAEELVAAIEAALIHLSGKTN